MSPASRARRYEGLARLLRSGMPLDQSAELAWASSPNPATALRSGTPLAAALAELGEPAWVLGLVAAGDRAGDLESALLRVAALETARDRARRLLLSRSAYPLFLAHVATMVPALPLVVASGASPWWFAAGPAAIWGLIALTWGLLRGSGRLGLGQRLAHRWPLDLVLRSRREALCCRLLSAGLGAGLLVDQALELAADGCGDATLSAALRHAAQGVRQGSPATLSQALAQAQISVPLIARVGIGEASGSSEVLDRLADELDELHERRLAGAARLVSGCLYALAVALAVVVILRMGMAYVQLINEVS